MALAWIREGLRDPKTFSCATCTIEQRRKRGHDGGVPWELGWGRYTYDRCPEQLVTPERLALLNLWSRYKRFGAPYQGGWMDWPARFTDLIEALDVEDEALTHAYLEWKKANPDAGE